MAGLTTRPSVTVERIVEELAAADGGRSVSSLLAKWILDRPEVQAKLKGGKQ
jgi:hypothetical protein